MNLFGDSLLVGGCEILSVDVAPSAFWTPEDRPVSGLNGRMWTPEITLTSDAAERIHKYASQETEGPLRHIALRIGTYRGAGWVARQEPMPMAMYVPFLYIRDGTHRLQIGTMTRSEAARFAAEADTTRAVR